MDIKTITDMLEMLTGVFSQAATPAGLAVLMAIIMTQAARIIADRWLRTNSGAPGLHKAEVWLISWVLTAFPCMALACWGLGVPWKGANFGLGMVAGIAGPFLVAALRKLGIDIDDYTPGAKP